MSLSLSLLRSRRSSHFSGCSNCSNSGTVCLVPRSSRAKSCIRCITKKRACSVKGIVKQLIRDGKLSVPEESMNLKISTKEDIMKLGLERGLELVFLQLFSFEQQVGERLEAIERALGKRAMNGEDSNNNGDDDWFGLDSQ